MNSGLVAVITTIQRPTAAVCSLVAELRRHGATLIVVGDQKGPDLFELPGAWFLPLSEQLKLPYALARLLPTGTYTRKNLGYLLAIQRGARCIYETDDDNAPGATWAPRDMLTEAQSVAQPGWLNYCRFFTDEFIWPRGFPLSRVMGSWGDNSHPGVESRLVETPVQQGLVDQSPDVDAIWRLLLDRPFYFRPGPSVHLPPGTWAPFNTQCTWWWPPAYPLLYLPSCCPFRVTDIWRSLVAQRCLWTLGYGLVVHGPEVVQDRNPHDLMRDFQDEVPGYLHNERIASLLTELRLEPGAEQLCDNLLRCYERLIREGLLPEQERVLLEAWLKDYRTATQADDVAGSA